MTFQDRDLDMLRRTDFMSFLEGSFSELFPQATFRDSPHIELLASKLAACLTGWSPPWSLYRLPGGECCTDWPQTKLVTQTAPRAQTPESAA